MFLRNDTAARSMNVKAHADDFMKSSEMAEFGRSSHSMAPKPTATVLPFAIHKNAGKACDCTRTGFESHAARSSLGRTFGGGGVDKWGLGS